MVNPDVRKIEFNTPGKSKSKIGVELDSRSPATIIPYSFYENHLSEIKITPTNIQFENITRGKIPIKSSIEVEAREVTPGKINNTVAKIKVYIGDIQAQQISRASMQALKISH